MSRTELKSPRGLRQWLQLYRLYHRAFPRSERKPFSVILRQRRKRKTDLWCICEGDRFAGLAATVNSPDLILLDYFAVAENLRSQGIGSRALALLKQQYTGKGLFVEIENAAFPGPDQPRRLRRKQFYLHAGMVPLGVAARVFGVSMELLGWNCRLTFDSYRHFYRDNYSPRVMEFITPEPDANPDIP